jgi:hypothetical protein
MRSKLCTFAALTALAVLATGDGFAQNKVRTETIRPPAAQKTAPPSRAAAVAKATPIAVDIISDPSQLPTPVARMRERILAAAHSGSLERVVTVMQSNEMMPVFSPSDDKDPLAYWKANYPDSEGLEVLAILTEVLEAPLVHVDKGTPQEMFLWPYFARMQLKDLTAEQKVALFRLVTGSDYRDMLQFGAYNFYRLGIAPDGTWHFFVTGD